MFIRDILSSGKNKIIKHNFIKPLRINLLIIILFLQIIALFFLFSSKKGIKEAGAAGNDWLTGWSYRKSVTIDNTLNSSDLTDYQVLITVDTAALIAAEKLQSLCQDIRFTDSDGSTVGPPYYWIESDTCNTATTKIWVKISSIPASSLKTIYMYYGHADAPAGADGTNTFDFFDDFEDGNLTDKWTIGGTPTYGSFTADNSVYKYGSYSMKGVDTSATSYPSAIVTQSFNSFIVEEYTRVSATNVVHFPFGWLSSTGASIYWAMPYSDTHWKYYTGSAYSNFPVDKTYAADTWYYMKIAFDSTTNKFKTWVGTSAVSPTYLGEVTGKDSSNNLVSGFQNIRILPSNTTGTGTTYVDDIRVRQYASTEPSTSIGSEILQSQSPIISSVHDYPDPQVSSSGISFSSVASDFNTEDTIKLYICKDSSCTNCNSLNRSNCWAYSESGSATNPTASYSCPSCANSENDYWAKVCDSNSNCSSILINSDSGWSYRVPITIDNTNGLELIDYPILVSIDTATLISADKMQDDCDDIKITDSDGSNSLNHWLESGCDTAQTKIWVEVPSVEVGSIKTIYLYYKKDDASSTSDQSAVCPGGSVGANCYEFTDAFTSYDTEVWTTGQLNCTSGTAAWTSVDNYVSPSSYCTNASDWHGPSMTATLPNSLGDYEWNYNYSISHPGSDLGRFYGKLLSDSSMIEGTMSYDGQSSSDNLGVVVLDSDHPDLSSYLARDCWRAGLNCASDAGSPHLWTERRVGDNLKAYLDNELKYNGTTVTTDVNKIYFSGEKYQAYAAITFSIDYASVRKYTPVEPLITPGNEESLTAQTFICEKANDCSCSCSDGTCSDCYGNYCCGSLCSSLDCNSYQESGYLISSTFDTEVASGAAYNSIMWQGTEPTGTDVKFQLATSDNSAGPWTFYGRSGDSCLTNEYYSAAPDTPIEIKCASIHNNKQYFRYKIFLTSNPGRTSTPTVTKVIVNYSP